jgi:hypothetical protein
MEKFSFEENSLLCYIKSCNSMSRMAWPSTSLPADGAVRLHLKEEHVLKGVHHIHKPVQGQVAHDVDLPWAVWVGDAVADSRDWAVSKNVSLQNF